MNDTSIQRAGAGLSLLFAAGERPDGATLQAAVAACQAQASVTRTECGQGTAELVASGLMFEVDGLAPAPAQAALCTRDSYGFAAPCEFAALEAVRLYPGHHLSGGVMLAPVTRALLALAAELAVSLPVAAVQWHSADTTIEPSRFSRSVLAWLAGGTFPAPGLAALAQLEDGSVVSRGLAHFVGQELTLRGVEDPARLKVASRVVDHLVRHGPVQAFMQWHLHDLLLCAEPAREARQVLVWPAG